MSMTIDYSIKNFSPEQPSFLQIMADNPSYLLVLLTLMAYSNKRGRTFPTMDTIAYQATNSVTRKAVAAKKWLLEHQAIALVPLDKRQGEERKIDPRQHVYQLTGYLISDDGYVYPYLYMNDSDWSEIASALHELGVESLSEKRAILAKRQAEREQMAAQRAAETVEQLSARRERNQAITDKIAYQRQRRGTAISDPDLEEKIVSDVGNDLDERFIEGQEEEIVSDVISDHVGNLRYYSNKVVKDSTASNDDIEAVGNLDDFPVSSTRVEKGSYQIPTSTPARLPKGRRGKNYYCLICLESATGGPYEPCESCQKAGLTSIDVPRDREPIILDETIHERDRAAERPQTVRPSGAPRKIDREPLPEITDDLDLVSLINSADLPDLEEFENPVVAPPAEIGKRQPPDVKANMKAIQAVIVDRWPNMSGAYGWAGTLAQMLTGTVPKANKTWYVHNFRQSSNPYEVDGFIKWWATKKHGQTGKPLDYPSSPDAIERAFSEYRTWLIEKEARDARTRRGIVEVDRDEYQ